MSADPLVSRKVSGVQEQLLDADDDDGDRVERRVGLCCDQKSSDELEVPVMGERVGWSWWLRGCARARAAQREGALARYMSNAITVEQLMKGGFCEWAAPDRSSISPLETAMGCTSRRMASFSVAVRVRKIGTTTNM